MEVFKKHRGKKPVVIYKTGSSVKGDQASRSHTGLMAGSHEIYMGAFRQAGTLANENLPSLALRSNPVDMGPAWYDAAAKMEIAEAVMG